MDDFEDIFNPEEMPEELKEVDTEKKPKKKKPKDILKIDGRKVIYEGTAIEKPSIIEARKFYNNMIWALDLDLEPLPVPAISKKKPTNNKQI